MCGTAGHCAMHALSAGETLSDGAESCVGNGVDLEPPHERVPWADVPGRERARSTQASACVNDHLNSNGGKRVGHDRPDVDGDVQERQVGRRRARSSLVIYYANGDCPTGLLRYFNVKVNGGAAQSRTFASMECGNWDKHWPGHGHARRTSSRATPTRSSSSATAATPCPTSTGSRSSRRRRRRRPRRPSREVLRRGLDRHHRVDAEPALRLGARTNSNLNVMAQASAASSWETFDIVDGGAGFVALKSHLNNLTSCRPTSA